MKYNTPSNSPPIILFVIRMLVYPGPLRDTQLVCSWPGLQSCGFTFHSHGSKLEGLEIVKMLFLFCFFPCLFVNFVFRVFPLFISISHKCVHTTLLFWYLRFTNHLYSATLQAECPLICVMDRVSWNSSQKIPPWHTSYFWLKCQDHNIPVVKVASIPVVWFRFTATRKNLEPL